jgi:hypothetical protein
MFPIREHHSQKANTNRLSWSLRPLTTHRRDPHASSAPRTTRSGPCPPRACNARLRAANGGQDCRRIRRHYAVPKRRCVRTSGRVGPVPRWSGDSNSAGDHERLTNVGTPNPPTHNFRPGCTPLAALGAATAGHARMLRSPELQCKSEQTAPGSSRQRLRTPASAGHC